MADNVQSASTSSKKKRKRRGKKTEGNTKEAGSNFAKPVNRADPVEELRQKLSEAKLAKNHELANKLRQQLWIAQDLSAGIEPNVSSEDQETLELVEEVKKYGIGSFGKEPAKETSITIPSKITGDADGKKMKNLRKKLTQIEKLKERVKAGEKLEANQLEKLKTEDEVREEIKHVEQLLSIPVKL